jgi:hypothetical protein
VSSSRVAARILLRLGPAVTQNSRHTGSVALACVLQEISRGGLRVPRVPEVVSAVSVLMPVLNTSLSTWPQTFIGVFHGVVAANIMYHVGSLLCSKMSRFAPRRM